MDSLILKDLEKEAQNILAKYDKKNAAVLPLLHLAQEKVGYVTPEAEAWVSKWSEVPVVHVREVVTFYSMYHEKPVGKHHIRFCTTTSCVLMGSEKILDCLKKKLGIENLPPPAGRAGAGRQACQTTSDGKISLEEAECLCACEMAPMMQVDGKYYGDLTEKKLDEIIEGLD